MRNLDGRVILSASDLMRFMGCAHVTTLDLALMRGAGIKPREDSEDAVLVPKQRHDTSSCWTNRERPHNLNQRASGKADAFHTSS